eukprot:2836362-Pyramimonas_sp.AAC.1
MPKHCFWDFHATDQPDCCGLDGRRHCRCSVQARAASRAFTLTARPVATRSPVLRPAMGPELGGRLRYGC